MLQTVLAITVVALALLYVTRRAWRTIAQARRRKAAAACGDGCGCGGGPAD